MNYNKEQNIQIIKHSEVPYYYKSNLNGLFRKEPYCYIKVNSYEEIRECIKYAKSINKRISIRNSGHSCCQYSTLEDTINIDMSNLNKILYINKDTMRAKVQSSLKFKDFYRITSTQQEGYLITSAGGSCGDVAIGGLVIGGGSNYLSPKWGTCIDSVIGMTLMLSDGSIIECNETNQYSDLFWAMRGSGHGISILLDVTLQLNPIEPLLYHNSIKLNYSSIHYFENLLIIDNFTKTMDTRIYLSIDCRKSFKLSLSPKLLSKLTYFFNGPSSEGEIHFKKLLSLLIKSDDDDNESFKFNEETMGFKKVEKSFYDIINSFQIEQNEKVRSFSKARFCKELNENSIKSIKNILESIPSTLESMNVPDKNSTFSMMMYYHGGHSKTISKDKCAYIHRDNNWSTVFMATYNEADNDDYFNRWKLIIDDNLQNIGYFIYQNYPDHELTLKLRNTQSLYKNDSSLQHPYFGHHFQKLFSIKLKYDPLDFFSNHPQSIILN
ncbi:hypothetical protein RB653_007098 [Dictyostelium firmibasis]|uniref:FAD-binding PCMH-type domain-containing protein n=1 Tax=Dictyostelium firmibasis TaxID=79012 RepID=A0AAN7TV44_9MYCE